MRIMSWNVNGYRAIIEKGFSDFLAEFEPDVLFLQEIKARPEQVPEQKRTFTGYEMIWNPAERPGYSGVAVIYKHQPDEVRFGLGVPEFDFEGRLIWMRYGDLWLANSYFPNGQRGRDRVEFKLAYYERLLELSLLEIEQGRDVIIGGDWNTAHTEIDLANPKENQETSGFLPEEREWVTRFLDKGFRDVYRELHPEARDFTWWTYRFNARVRDIGWRIDYFLMNSRIAEKVRTVKNLQEVMGSDHCPILLELDI